LMALVSPIWQRALIYMSNCAGFQRLRKWWLRQAWLFDYKRSKHH